jgi:hypothetical protein
VRGFSFFLIFRSAVYPFFYAGEVFISQITHSTSKVGDGVCVCETLDGDYEGEGADTD